MASSYMLRPLCTSHLFYPSPSSQDRVSCTGLRRRRRSVRPVFVLRCRRDLGLWTDFSPLSVKLTAPSGRINGVVLPQGNLSGQINIVASAEVDAKVTNSQLIDTQPLSDESSAVSNGAVPLGPAPDPGPEFDYQVYAANTMVGYEPPPPPRIPFGGPFEDYYDEYVGVDYVPKQEKPTSSFLMFLDSLNEKRAEEEAKLREKDPSRPPFDPKPNKNLFAGSKPLFTISRPTHPAPLPREYTPPSLDPTAETTSRTFSSGSRFGVEGRQVKGKPADDGVKYEVPTSVTLPIDLEDMPSKQVGKPSPVSQQSGVVEEFSPSPGTSTPLMSPQTRSDVSAATTAFSPPLHSAPAAPPSRLAEEPTFGERPLSPSLRPTGDDASGRPLSPSTRPLEASSSRPLSPSTRPFEAPVDASGSLFPQTRSVGEVKDDSRMPQSNVTSPVEESRPFVSQSRPLEETKEDRPFIFPRKPIEENSTFAPQSRPQEEMKEERPSMFQRNPVEESKPIIPQNRPLEETKEERPFIFLRRDMEENKKPVEESKPEETKEERPFIFLRRDMEENKKPVEENKPIIAQNRPLEETREERPFIFLRRDMEENKKPVEESKPIIPQNRPLEETREERPFIFLRRDMEENKPQAMPSGSNRLISPQGRPSEGINGSNRPLFSQNRPVEASPSVPQGRPLNETVGSSWSPPQSNISRDDSQRLTPQTDGMVQPPVSGQVTTSDAPGVAPPNTEFYEPMEGDIVLGVVIYANEDEVGLEIGGRVPALMTMREFQPLAEIGDNSFFKIPLGDDSNETLEGFVAPPLGKVMLVEDKAANDGVYRGENVNIGTIVIAAVQSRDLIDGRPVVTCRRLAKSLAFVRIEQLMRTGEAIQLEITQSNDGGLQGYLEGVRAFLPRSELLRRPENSAVLQEYVGKTLTVAVLQAEEYASNVIISEVKPWMSKNLLLGSVHDLTVTRIYPYGMQVEIENTRVRGFIHISNITRGYVTSLSASFVEGEKIKAMVIRGRKPGQLSFSLEALEPPSEEGLVLRDKQQVFLGAEEMARSSQEFQSPMEERHIFIMPYASTSVNVRDTIANLHWLQLEKLKSSS